MQQPGFFDLVAPGHFAGTIEAEDSCETGKQVTVGGRLQSTKIMKQSSTESEQDQKEQFKVSVGLQVSTPIVVGAGVKHEQEKGKSSSANTTTVRKAENNVFEAVGGNTILAAK